MKFLLCIFLACGTCSGVNGAGGTIESPDYPNDYGNFRDCTYTIIVPNEYKIQLVFNTFLLDFGLDFVTVS